MAFARVAHQGTDRARCAVSWYSDGKKVQRTVACACRGHKQVCAAAREEAKQIAREQQAQRRNQADTARVDVGTVVDAWLKTKGMMSGRGFRKYETIARHWKKWFVEKLQVPRFYMLTAQHVEAYRDGRFAELRARDRDGHCEKTVHAELTTLRQLCKWATRNPSPEKRYLSRDVTEEVELPPLPGPGDYAFNAEQKRKILESAAADPQLSLMLHLGFYAGLRREGVARLRVADVKLDQVPMVLSVEEKGRATRLGSQERRRRTVPIVAELAAALRRCPPVAGSEYWFGDLGAQEVEQLSAVLCGHIKRATGLTGLRARFHNCRHTCGTELARRTNDLTVAARILGHRSTRTTERYRTVTTDDLVTAMAKLSNG